MKLPIVTLAIATALGVTACVSKPPRTAEPPPAKILDQSSTQPATQNAQPGAAQAAPVAADVVTLIARVNSIDLATRTVTLKGKDGKLLPMRVAKSVPDFNNVKVGDDFEVQYAQAVAVGLIKAPKDAQPGAAEVHTLIVNGQGKDVEPFSEERETIYTAAKIVSINASKRVAVLKDADGKLVKVKIDQRVLGLNKFKTGNDVIVEYVQNIAIGFTAIDFARQATRK